MRRLMIFLSFAFLMLSISGCASMRANSARQAYIHSATKSYVHKASLESIFPEARKILFEYGYQVRDSNDNSLETEWARDDATERRYLVTATKVKTGYSLQFTLSEIHERSTNTSTSRDLDVEWVLIQRVDPAFAREVQAEADVRGQAAAN
jgi:hypothetical protein